MDRRFGPLAEEGGWAVVPDVQAARPFGRTHVVAEAVFVAQTIARPAAGLLAGGNAILLVERMLVCLSKDSHGVLLRHAAGFCTRAALVYMVKARNQKVQYIFPI